jgi:ribosomal protein S27E
VNNTPVTSNVATASFMGNGGVCSDPATGLTGTQIGQLTSQTSYKTGAVIVGQNTSPGSGTTTAAVASFQSYTGSTFSTGGSVSIGSCSVSQTVNGSATGTVTGLNAGTISVTPPGGSATQMQSIPQSPGTYFAQISSIPSSGGTFAFAGTGASGSNTVGPFTANVNFPNPLISWTNQSASATVTRGSGQTYNWTGGAAGTYVTMSGSASSGSVSGSYTCIAPVEAKTFTVPSYILFTLPAASGTSMLSNSTNYATFTATGIDYGFAIGSVGFSVNSTFN